MRRRLIDSLKFPVVEPDYRYDRIKKKGEERGEEKKTRDLEEGNVVEGGKKSKREKKIGKMRGCHGRISIA